MLGGKGREGLSRRAVYSLLILIVVLGSFGGARLFGLAPGVGGLFFASDDPSDQAAALGIDPQADGGAHDSGSASSDGSSGTVVTPPMRIDIPSIGVSSSLLRLGLNADRTMQVPTNFSLAGWYDGSAEPGDWGKPSVILGHVDSTSGPAVFYRLKMLQPGASVWVLRGDQTWVRFVVDRVAEYSKNHFPTKLIYAPRPGRTVRLITCGGAFDYSTGHYVDNIVAFGHLA